MVVCVKDYVKKNNATCRIEAAIYIGIQIEIHSSTF